MIDWRPIAEMPEEMLDGREVLLAIPNTLGTADGGDGKGLNPRFPYIYELAEWRVCRASKTHSRCGRWKCRDGQEWEREDASHYAEVTAPGLITFTQSGGQLIDQLGFRVAWTPTSRHEIAGRGTVFTGPYPFICSTGEAVGRTVVVDGEEYAVRGVEWNLGVPPRPGDAVGLLVRRA